MLLQNRIFTAEAPRTQRKHFFLAGDGAKQKGFRLFNASLIIRCHAKPHHRKNESHPEDGFHGRSSASHGLIHSKVPDSHLCGEGPSHIPICPCNGMSVPIL